MFQEFAQEIYDLLFTDFNAFLDLLQPESVLDFSGFSQGIVPFSQTFTGSEGFSQGFNTLLTSTSTEVFSIEEIIGNSFAIEVNAQGELISTPQANRVASILEEERTVVETGSDYRLDILNFFTLDPQTRELTSLDIVFDSYVSSEAFAGESDAEQISNPDIDPFVNRNPLANSDQTLEAVLDFFTALLDAENSNFEMLRPTLADDAVLWYPGDPEILSYAGIFQGEDTVIQGFEERDNFSFLENIEIQEVFVDRDRAIARVSETRTNAETEREYSLESNLLFTVANGLVDSVQFIYDSVIETVAATEVYPFAQNTLVFGSPNNDNTVETVIELPADQLNVALVFSGAGSDLIDGSLKEINQDRFYAGTESDEILVGTRDRAFGGEGNDILDATVGGGNNRLDGGVGNDEIYVLTNDRAFGGEGQDIIDATLGEGNNRLYGGEDADIFFLGVGDRAIGGAGDDAFYVGTGGDNLLTGGKGADAFWIANAQLPSEALNTDGNLPEVTNIITDFEIGVDFIGIGGFGITNFSELSILDSDQGAIIGLLDQNVAILTGVTSAQLEQNQTNFIFG